MFGLHLHRGHDPKAVSASYDGMEAKVFGLEHLPNNWKPLVDPKNFQIIENLMNTNVWLEDFTQYHPEYYHFPLAKKELNKVENEDSLHVLRELERLLRFEEICREIVIEIKDDPDCFAFYIDLCVDFESNEHSFLHPDQGSHSQADQGQIDFLLSPTTPATLEFSTRKATTISTATRKQALSKIQERYKGKDNNHYRFAEDVFNRMSACSTKAIPEVGARMFEKKWRGLKKAAPDPAKSLMKILKKLELYWFDGSKPLSEAPFPLHQEWLTFVRNLRIFVNNLGSETDSSSSTALINEIQRLLRQQQNVEQEFRRLRDALMNHQKASTALQFRRLFENISVGSDEKSIRPGKGERWETFWKLAARRAVDDNVEGSEELRKLFMEDPRWKSDPRKPSEQLLQATTSYDRGRKLYGILSDEIHSYKQDTFEVNRGNWTADDFRILNALRPVYMAADDVNWEQERERYLGASGISVSNSQGSVWGSSTGVPSSRSRGSSVGKSASIPESEFETSIVTDSNPPILTHKRRQSKQ